MELQSHFDLIFLRYRKQIETYLYRRVKDREIAKDLAQEVFLKMYRSLVLFDSARSISSLLWTIVKNTLVDHQRKWTHETNVKNEILVHVESTSYGYKGPSPEDALIQKQLIHAVRVRLSEMKNDQLHVLRLRLLEGLRVVDIAKNLGLNVSQVKSILFRARSRLVNRSQMCLE